MMKEYVVTLKNYEDLDGFYQDMETPGGNLFIPNRSCDCSLRRQISRNTNYFLFENEVNEIKKDPRVLNIVSADELDSLIVEPRYDQTSTEWNKSSSIANNHKNWGLLRCVNGEQISNWGSNGTSTQTAKINITSSGKNVDVVIIDGHLNPNHPEFSLNSDGSGGTRVIQYNWYQHTNYLGLGSDGTYIYPIGSDLSNADNNHGMHVAGTVAGNTQGWARNSNIYNISPYSTNPNTLASSYQFDYVRAFHRNKPINPITGIKNPTICNSSWGSIYQITRTSITNVNYKGVDYTTGFNIDSNLNTWGLVRYTATYVYIDAWTDALIVDLVDAMNEGIIMVGAAGNSNIKIDSFGGIDYDNTITWSGYTRNYHRGSWNSTGGNSICVGAASALTNDSKATFSHCGPRINVYSPGVNIISALHDGESYRIATVSDSRNSSYVLGKLNGTSMASPQVCGILACALEQYPRMTPQDAISYINKYSKTNQIFDSGGGYTDTTSLKGSKNNYAFFQKERKDSGVLQPRESFKVRPSSGQLWPRRNTFHYSK